MVLDSILNPVLSPLLKLPPVVGILLISLIISLFVTLLYKKLTDQRLMKDLKDEIKSFQKQMKELRDNPEKMMKVQKQAMETNMKYMMHSFKPTLFTIIPLILIFGWLNTHMGYEPIVSGEEFSVTAFFVENTEGDISLDAPSGIELMEGPTKRILNSKAEWVMKGSAGEYTLSYTYDNKEFAHSLIITESPEDKHYRKPQISYRELGLDKYTRLREIVISNEKVRPFADIPLVRSIPWIGGWGWLGAYILFSIIFSMLLRKLFKVY